VRRVARRRACDPTFRRALLWLDRHPFVDGATGRFATRDVGDQTARPPYYELLAIERLGAFTGLERLGGADWYRVGVASLRALQAADGRWPGGTAEAAFRNAVEHTTLALLFLTRAIDAVPVTSPDLTTGDLVGGRDALEPHFSDLVARAVRAHADAEGDARTAWQRSSRRACAGSRSCACRPTPAGMAPAAHGLLRKLTGFPVEAKVREARSLAWARFLFAHRATLAPRPTASRRPPLTTASAGGARDPPTLGRCRRPSPLATRPARPSPRATRTRGSARSRGGSRPGLACASGSGTMPPSSRSTGTTSSSRPTP
jgi:hypothetical protein